MEKVVSEALSRVYSTIEKRDGIHILHTSELKRVDRELLVKTGWLEEITKGWYLFVRPDIRPGDSSRWYANFWDFLYIYLTHFYGKEYCLSAEHSLELHLGKTVVPRQVIAMAPKGRGAPLGLPFNTSLLIYSSGKTLPTEREAIKRLQVMSLPYALCKVSPSFFRDSPREAEIALHSIKNADDLLRVIIGNNFVRAAGRLIGAYRFFHNEKMVSLLLKGLATTTIKIQESNPFENETPTLLASPNQSPYFSRIIAMWQHYRTDVIENFPSPPGLPSNAKKYLEQVDEQYAQDAYHSLSIEGYQVTQNLIEQVRKAEWNPDGNDQHLQQRDTLAARGYYESFLSVKSSLAKILDGNPAGEIIETDLSTWYKKLFAPCVAAGIIEPSDLFGYRRHQVYIRSSRHTPFPTHGLGDAMDALFFCLRNEEHAGVSAILGHFIFVFIHPYMDGNGRIGRFLMNTLFSSGGYPWTIIHLKNRNQYMAALEEASVGETVTPFVRFLQSEL